MLVSSAVHRGARDKLPEHDVEYDFVRFFSLCGSYFMHHVLKIAADKEDCFEGRRATKTIGLKKKERQRRASKSV